MPTADRTIYLVDGTSQLYRAYFALGHLSNAEGLPTNAVYGFTTMLRKLLREEQPPFIAVAFDPPGPVFRHDSFSDYKANRPPTPEDLRAQVPYAKQVCGALGVPVLEVEGYEADDVIATYARQARDSAFEVIVVASDKDLYQLVGEGVTVLDPSKNVRLDAEGVTETFGVPPERVRDVLGLMGDSVDNIPGVPGVGQKTALATVTAYGDVDSVVRRAELFVATWEARDAALVSFEAVAAESELRAPTAEAVPRVVRVLAEALDALLEIEAVGEFRSRLEAVRRLLDDVNDETLTAAVGGSGRKAARSLAALKRELKALDRGSSKRIWLAIRDYAEQARLSKRLATLQDQVPFAFEPQRLRCSGPDEGRARRLFASLGFRSLVDEYGDETVQSADPPETERELSHEVVLGTDRLIALAAAIRASGGPLAIVPIQQGGGALRSSLVGLALSHQAGSAVYVPLGHDYLGVPEQLPLESVRKALGALLADAELPKTGHDVKSAIHVLRRHGLSTEGWCLDTMVGVFLLNPGRTSYGLPRLTEEFLGSRIEGLDALLGSGATRRQAGTVELETLGAFAARWADAILALEGALGPRLQAAGLSELYERIDGPLLPLLARMETWGIRIDTGLLGGMSTEMENELERCRGEIHELAGGAFNIDSPKQLREVLFDRLELKTRRKTAKTGAASTDAQTLDELAPQHAIAAKLLEYRELSKLKGTYVDALPRLVDPDTGRVHTSYHPTGAATGRLSSSDPNLQNIPARTHAGRQIRRAFVPDRGFVFLSADYSQIELRVLAHMAGDPGLIEAFRAGEDIHRHTASKVFGVLPGLVDETMRRRAKAVNFGLLYGMSETRLAREQGMKRAEARGFVETYFERFAKVREYIDAAREQARREGAVRTLFGRVRYFPQLHERTNRGVQEQALRAAVNTTIQGTAADLMKMAMLRVEAALDRAKLEARMLLQVHDELLLEVPRASIEPVASIVREQMEGVHPLDVPLVVDQKTGENWLAVT